MLRNYILLFVRNLKRQKLFSFINLLGLTVSMACTLLIYLYVKNEFSYDRFHKHADRIYRVNQTFIWGENDNHQFGSTGPGVATALKEELPEVEMITSIHTPGNFIVSYTNQSNKVVSFEEEQIFAADSNFFKMFTFPFIKGDAATALTQVQTMVMTESTAKKYFNTEDPIGKMVRLGEGDNQQTYEVTGVVKDPPDNSYIDFDMLLSMNSFPLVKKLYWSWIWTQLETYVLLDENAKVENTRAKLQQIPRKFAEETLQRVMNTSYDEYIKSGKKWELFLQPLTEIHLPKEMVYNRINDSGNLKVVYSLIGAAVFIVLLSCVNFMNLSTAQFTRRLKEASIRKIMGLSKVELSINYFLEAFIFCLLAVVVALGLTQLLLPAFNFVTEKRLTIDVFDDPGIIAALLFMVVFMSVLSGSYPAIFLSAFHPVEAMKGKVKTGREGKAFRNGLVVFQFAVSIILVISTAIVFEQLNYSTGKDLGFDKENLLVIKHIEGIKDGESMANAALNIPGAVNATWCTSLPPKVFGGDKFTADGMNDATLALNYTTADDRFIPTLDIKVNYGRNFSVNNPGDGGRVILNETAVKRIGWYPLESAIGKKIRRPGDNKEFEVVGVVKDFNYWPLQSAIEPMAIFNVKESAMVNADQKHYIAVKIAVQDPEAWKKTLLATKTLWKEHAGDAPFDYEFVDEVFAKSFKTQERFGSVLTVLAGLAILIACLGLLGMIIYTLEQRTKEIGIRKVSGASVFDIFALISKGYTRLIVLAFIIGAPVSYWMMDHWLQDFAYRITPSPWIFACAGLGTLLMAILITSFHAVKASLLNPITVLKDE